MRPPSNADATVYVSGPNGKAIAFVDRQRASGEHLANSDLIAAAFNAATAAADMGFDPIAAVEALPKLLGGLQSTLRALDAIGVVHVAPEFQDDKTLLDTRADISAFGGSVAVWGDAATFARKAIAAARGEVKP